MRCPTPVWSTSKRALDDRVFEPSGLDPVCLHSVYTRDRDKTLEDFAREGLVLAPLNARPDAMATKIFTEDYLAGDADNIFFSVNMPAPQTGGMNLIFDVETLGSLGPLGYRPFDLILLYREVLEEAQRNPPYASWHLPGLRAYLNDMDASIGSRIRSPEQRRAIDSDQRTPFLREYLKRFADCFTIWGEPFAKSAIQFWADFSGTIRDMAEFIDEGMFVSELREQPWFAKTLQNIRAFRADMGDKAPPESWIWHRYWKASRWIAANDSIFGEVLLQGSLPVCCARGYALWEISKTKLGHEVVADTVVAFGKDVCGDGLSAIDWGEHGGD